MRPPFHLYGSGGPGVGCFHTYFVSFSTQFQDKHMIMSHNDSNLNQQKLSSSELNECIHYFK